MRKLGLTLAVVALFALPAMAGAQDDPYIENPPTVPGGDPNSPGGPGGDTDPGTVPGTASGTASASGTTAGTASGAASGSLTEAQAGRAGNGVDAGQLPATGFDRTAAMALLGGLLLAGGIVVRRRALAGA
jgi:LPXTG-motif cell wall-anchored protein